MVGKNKNKFVCFIDGWNDDYLDEAQCFIAKFALFLYNINFGYICAALLIIILLISLFGGIKEHYRWFILNIAVWDLIITYDYICDHEIYYHFYRREGESSWSSDVEYFLQFFNDIIDSNPYSSLLLLSFTRFIALYFMNFYEKLTRKRRVLYLIIIYNFVIIFLHIDNGFGQLGMNRSEYLHETCVAKIKPKNSKNFEKCYEDFILEYLRKIEIIFRFAVYLKPFVCLSLSIISAIMIIARLIKHAKFQIKQNRRDFIKSFRVFVVILLQTLINIIFFCVEFFQNISIFMISIFNVRVVTFKLDSCENDYFDLNSSCIEIKLPNWLGVSIGLTDPMIFIAIRQLRIFMEAIIVLSIMTGYREAIIDLAKFIFKVMKNPKKACEQFMLYVRKTKVTPY